MYCNPNQYKLLINSCRFPVANRPHKFAILSDPGEEVIQVVLHIVCREYGLTNSQIKSKNRSRIIVEARSMAMMFMHEKNRPPVSLTKVRIGKVFNKDHSTVIYSIGTINDVIETDISVKKMHDKINKELNIAFKLLQKSKEVN